MQKQSIKTSLIVLVSFFLPLSSFVDAKEKLTIPDKIEDVIALNDYSSVGLILNPCVLVTDKDFMKSAEEARKQYPKGTCDNPKLIQKIFQARFLQASLIPLVDEPWNIGHKIDQQDKIIQNCKDTVCLEKSLANIITEFSPLYLNLPQSPSTLPFNEGNNPNKIILSKKMELQKRKIIKELSASSNQCQGAGAIADVDHPNIDKNSQSIPYPDVDYQLYRTDKGILFIGICQISGLQPNTETWVYLLNNRGDPERLFDNEGPVMQLKTSCNHMPDLMTAIKQNAGMYYMFYYRFNGTNYVPVYNYTVSYLGDEDNPMPIASEIGEVKDIACQQQSLSIIK